MVRHICTSVLLEPNFVYPVYIVVNLMHFKKRTAKSDCEGGTVYNLVRPASTAQLVVL
jgi:hypothetical protein